MEIVTKNPGVSPRRGVITGILVVAGLWTLLHVYLGQRLLAQTPLAPGWRLLGWVGVLVLVLAPFVALFAGRTERLTAKRGLEVAGFTAMGLSSLLIVFGLAGAVLHGRAWLGVGGSQLAVVGGAVAVLMIGLWRARRPATVRVVDVPITGLPSDLEGFRIAQLSDLHVGPTLKRDFVERVVDTTNGLQPNLIALTGAPASDVRVLLAHQPKSAFAARAAGYDLQLSGHTHGGQYFPFNLLVRLFQPFVAGLHRLEAMWLYVSRGTGYWGPPLRLGAPAEITLIQLVRA